jgi:ferredoxin
MNEAGMPAIDYDRCYGCGNCVTKCPENALRLEEVRGTDHVHKEDNYFS